MNGTDRLERALAPACASAGVELVDVEFAGRTLQVTVERPDGLDLDLVATASRAISEVLDADESLVPGGRYELEVSTPGLERRLRRPEHFARAVGSAVAVRTVAGTDGERRCEGALTAVDDDGIDVEVADHGHRHIPFSAIERAHTVFDWQAALRSAPESANTDRATTRGREA